jgi:outer membrane receptor for ferrienterochelin and colicin
MKIKHHLALGFILLSTISFSQKVTISGYIEDADSGEKLIGATIYDPSTNAGTVSNTFGFYSFTLKSKESLNLVFSYIGYESKTITIVAEQSQQLNIVLSVGNQLDAVEIIATEENRIEKESQMSVAYVPIKQIKKIPALLGEVDVLKALQLLPGVQSGGEGQSGLYVRGGSPDQNLLLLDGVPVYNASHLFGFFSVFNSDAIKDVKLVKGGFPARYGGRLSSVLEINLKEGNNQEFHGDLSIGLVASKLTLEGPINKGKTSFMISGRRTYIDLLARPFIKKSFEDEGNDGGFGYYFYDLNAKINHKFSDRDRLYASVYTGTDKFYFNLQEKESTYNDFSDFGFQWGNITSAFRWNHIINDRLFMNTTLTYSRYRLSTGVKFGTEFTDTDEREEIGLDYGSGIRDYAAKLDFDYVPNTDHFIRFGLSVIDHEFNPGVFKLDRIDTETMLDYHDEYGQDKVRSLEFATYIEDDINLSDKLKVNAGLHFSGFNVKGTTYTSLQPRVSSRYLLSDHLSAKASFATMRQYINLLAFEGAGAPTDLWLPTTDRIKPQESWQAAIGLAKTFDKSYEVSIEGYYKKMKNLISYKDGSGLFETTDWQNRVTQGDGEAFGAELFVQKKQGKLSGWIGYTLSWSKRQFEDLNNGNEFPYRYDRRHDISVVGIYELSKRINVSGTWVYGTGNAITLATSRFTQLGNLDPEDNYGWINTLQQYGDRNDFRMNAYHRFDIGINFIKEKKNRTRTWSLGAYNAYNRKNPYFLYYDYDFDRDQEVLKQVSLFPIIPYVTYSLKF